ncbi:MAG: AMP-binding protein [Pseudomonadota bacterium]
MADQVCDAHIAAGRSDRTAIIDLTTRARRDVSFADLQRLSFRVQSALLSLGVVHGDRIGVLLSQSPFCAAAHIAIWRIGAISVPLFKLFAHEALASRIEDSGLQIAVTDDTGIDMLSAFSVATVTAADLPSEAVASVSADTGPETPAVLIYTSGTTGKPKGALHGHRMLVGHMPGVIASHNGLGEMDDCLWTPADWAWIGGLFDVLMPGLALAVPVVASRAEKFSGQAAGDVCRNAGVRNAFLPPTALRMLKAGGHRIAGLRSVASGGEPLGAEVLAWGQQAFGLTINEFYGQTECNMVVSANARDFDTPTGAIGKPVTGFDVAVVDTNGQPTDAEGDIAIAAGAPSMMLGYWQNAPATAAKYRGKWMLTGDRGRARDGFIWFVGRDDDVITSAGYRIGPAEVEDCLLTHPAVATAGVVGKPDPLRTEIVKAYVVLKPRAEATVQTLQDHVKARLASHCYPREVAFVEALPMTVTGKIRRKELRARAVAEAHR